MTPQALPRFLAKRLGFQGNAKIVGGRPRAPIARPPAALGSRYDSCRASEGCPGRLRHARSLLGADRWLVGRNRAMTADNGNAAQASAHVPVLLHAVLEQLAVHDGGIYLDGTFGA